MNSQFDLTGKTILVTGASSGIGRQIAKTLSEAGACLIITGRNRKELDITMQMMMGDNHKSLLCDLTSVQDRAGLADQLPKLDGIVYSAGVLDIKPIKYIDIDDINMHTVINYQVPVLLMQEMITHKLLNKGTSIVFISSISARLGAKGFGLYAGSKGALEAFSRVLALELASQSIRVNCLAPGMVKTPMFDKTGDILSDETLSENEKLYPLGFLNPTDVANGIQYLLSDAAAKITGTTLIIDGGLSIS